MKDHIFFDEVSSAMAYAYDWIDVWLREGHTKEELLEAFGEMIDEVEAK